MDSKARNRMPKFWPATRPQVKTFRNGGLQTSVLFRLQTSRTDEWNKWMEKKYLRKSAVLLKKNLVSIDGKQLDEQLIDFTKLSKIKIYYTITKNIWHEEIPENDQLLHPVYITPEERAELNNVRKKTKETLRSYINCYISRISCRNTQEYFQSLLNDSKDSHSSLVDIFLELKEFVDEQND